MSKIRITINPNKYGAKKAIKAVDIKPNTNGEYLFVLDTTDPKFIETFWTLRKVYKKLEALTKYEWVEVDRRFISVFLKRPCKEYGEGVGEKVDLDYQQYNSLEELQKFFQQQGVENCSLENLVFLALDDFLRESHPMQIAKRLDPQAPDKIYVHGSYAQRELYDNIWRSGYCRNHFWKRIVSRHQSSSPAEAIRHFIKYLTPVELNMLRVVFNLSNEDFRLFMEGETREMSDRARELLSPVNYSSTRPVSYDYKKRKDRYALLDDDNYDDDNYDHI